MGYWTQFTFRILLSDVSVGKNVIICEIDISSSVEIDDKEKDVSPTEIEKKRKIAISPIQILHDTTLSAETLHYN